MDPLLNSKTKNSFIEYHRCREFSAVRKADAMRNVTRTTTSKPMFKAAPHVKEKVVEPEYVDEIFPVEEDAPLTLWDDLEEEEVNEVPGALEKPEEKVMDRVEKTRPHETLPSVPQKPNLRDSVVQGGQKKPWQAQKPLPRVKPWKKPSPNGKSVEGVNGDAKKNSTKEVVRFNGSFPTSIDGPIRKVEKRVPDEEAVKARPVEEHPENGKEPSETLLKTIPPDQDLPPIKRFLNAKPLDKPVFEKPIKGTVVKPAKPVIQKERITLEEVLEKNKTLPRNSAIFGVCEDKLPLLLNFSDPSPGSILILGDDAAANKTHLLAILESVYRLGTADRVQVHLISPDSKPFEIRDKGHIRQMLVPYERKVYDLLGELFELAQDRLQERGSVLPVTLLVIEGLELLVEQLDAQSLSFLRWLMRRGAEAGVWTIGSLTAGLATPATWKTIRAFETRLVGPISNRKFVASFCDIGYDTLNKVVPGEQGYIKLGDREVLFDIAVLREDNKERIMKIQQGGAG